MMPDQREEATMEDPQGIWRELIARSGAWIDDQIGPPLLSAGVLFSQPVPTRAVGLAICQLFYNQGIEAVFGATPFGSILAFAVATALCDQEHREILSLTAISVGLDLKIDHDQTPLLKGKRVLVVAPTLADIDDRIQIRGMAAGVIHHGGATISVATICTYGYTGQPFGTDISLVSLINFPRMPQRQPHSET